MNALLDTGFLLAVIDEDDNLHALCAAALQSERNPLLPDLVLPELAYLVLRNLGYPALDKFLRAVAIGELEVIKTTTEDIRRAADLLMQYADSKVDFVDCVLVALAERLKVQRMLTVDVRHFTLFRPRHCQAFEIIPAPHLY